MKQGDRASVVEDDRIHFDAIAFRDLLGRAAGHIYLPEMTAIDVILVRCNDYE